MPIKSLYIMQLMADYRGKSNPSINPTQSLGFYPVQERLFLVQELYFSGKIFGAFCMTDPFDYFQTLYAKAQARVEARYAKARAAIDEKKQRIANRTRPFRQAAAALTQRLTDGSTRNIIQRGAEAFLFSGILEAMDRLPEFKNGPGYTPTGILALTAFWCAASLCSYNVLERVQQRMERSIGRPFGRGSVYFNIFKVGLGALEFGPLTILGAVHLTGDFILPPARYIIGRYDGAIHAPQRSVSASRDQAKSSAITYHASMN